MLYILAESKAAGGRRNEGVNPYEETKSNGQLIGRLKRFVLAVSPEVQHRGLFDPFRFDPIKLQANRLCRVEVRISGGRDLGNDKARISARLFGVI